MMIDMKGCLLVVAALLLLCWVAWALVEQVAGWLL